MIIKIFMLSIILFLLQIMNEKFVFANYHEHFFVLINHYLCLLSIKKPTVSELVFKKYKPYIFLDDNKMIFD